MFLWAMMGWPRVLLQDRSPGNSRELFRRRGGAMQSVVMSDPIDPSEGNWPRDWLIVFLMNLPAPVALAWMVTEAEDHARIGMFLALLLCLHLGLWICSWPNPLRRSLIRGGRTLAILQFLP